jgi:hypothetical protein
MAKMLVVMHVFRLWVGDSCVSRWECLDDWLPRIEAEAVRALRATPGASLTYEVLSEEDWVWPPMDIGGEG